MAMINPPIEELFDKANSRYALVVAVSKRSKELLIERPEYFRENQKVKPIEFASQEFYNDGYTIEKNRLDI